jgi:hypothetical protein
MAVPGGGHSFVCFGSTRSVISTTAVAYFSPLYAVFSLLGKGLPGVPNFPQIGDEKGLSGAAL